MRKFSILFWIIVFSGCQPQQDGADDHADLRISVSFTSEQSQNPLDGRLLMIISKDGSEKSLRPYCGTRQADSLLGYL